MDLRNVSDAYYGSQRSSWTNDERGVTYIT